MLQFGRQRHSQGQENMGASLKFPKNAKIKKKKKKLPKFIFLKISWIVGISAFACLHHCKMLKMIIKMSTYLQLTIRTLWYKFVTFQRL